jgi:two-component system, LuxR family, sensor kinase FixL
LQNLSSLINSDEWLKDLFDHSSDLIQIVSMQGRVEYVNKAWHKLLQYESGDIKNKTIYDFVEPNDIQKFTDYRQKVINGQVLDSPITFNLISKTGEKFTVEGTVSVKTENGSPVYTRGIFRNVSDRIENERQLWQLNQQLTEREYNVRQLLTHAPDAVIVISNEGLVTYWNPQAERLFGWTADEMRNRSLSATIIPPQYREAHDVGMKRYLATGEARVLNKTIEITALRRNGEEFYVSLTISRASQLSGHAFIAFIRDISDRKKTETEIHKKSVHLEESNKRLQEFVYAASHDLKQPIRKIQIFLERLNSKNSDNLDADDKMYLSKIEDSALRMKSLIEDLLTFSSLEQKSEWDNEVDLNDVIKEVMHDLEVELHERQTEIDLYSLPIIKGNRMQLHQLFHNLLSNSIKYARPEIRSRILIREGDGSKSIEIDGHVINPAVEAYHLIECSDNGIGFPPEQSEKIFEIFKRLHVYHKYPGTGVGLAIARKIVENHQGYIKAYSGPGQGATFKILIPKALK